MGFSQKRKRRISTKDPSLQIYAGFLSSFSKKTPTSKVGDELRPLFS